MKKKSFPGVLVLMVYTSILVFIFRPYLQNTLNINSKNSGFIVLVSVISFLIGALTIFICNKFDKPSR